VQGNALHYLYRAILRGYSKVKANTMRFAFIPKAAYTIGQVIQVQGRKMRVESYTHTGRNVIACTLDNAPKFERIACICTDSPAIEGVTA
jgi:hypothetical protein